MPDARLARTRETLPSGYQFGDAGSWAEWPDGSIGPFNVIKGVEYLTWRAPQENAADRLARYQDEYEAGPI